MDFADAVRFGCMLDLLEQAPSLVRRSKHGFEGRPFTDPRARWGVNRSVVGFIDVGNQLEQARLPCAVAADEDQRDSSPATQLRRDRG